MQIQALMMKKLFLSTWEEVEHACPMTSMYKALKEFFIVFREWVSVFIFLIELFIVVFPKQIDNCRNHLTLKTLETLMKVFQARLLRTWNRQSTKKGWQKERSWKCMKIPREWKVFCKEPALSDNSIICSVFNGEVGIMLTTLPKRLYTLLISDIPYGFQITGSMYDDVSYKYPLIMKMVTNFTKLILTPLWRIVIFHSMGQSLLVTNALKARCHTTKHMHW